MTIEGKIGSFSRNEEQARGVGHDPVIMGLLFAAIGILAMGRLVTRAATGLVAFVVASAEVLATGDGATQVYTGTLANFPLEPGTVSITDGVETFTDDGFGRLWGDAGGTGTFRYDKGIYALDFNANVADGTDITSDYVTAIDGVLDEDLDTAQSSSANCVVHGAVKLDVLKVNNAGDAPSAAVLSLLAKKGIYAS